MNLKIYKFTLKVCQTSQHMEIENQKMIRGQREGTECTKKVENLEVNNAHRIS